MKLFTIIAEDGTDSVTLRARHLDAHLKHVEANLARYAVAGPLREANGMITGSPYFESRVDCRCPRVSRNGSLFCCRRLAFD